MNNILSFTDFLFESKTSIINKETVKEFLQKKCSYFDGDTANIPLFRGTSNKFIYGFIEPKKFIKPRQTRTNMYPIIPVIDSLPSWQKYPPRGKSVIMSTSLSTADSFRNAGNTYAVFPADNSNMGICGGKDFNISRKKSDNWNYIKKISKTESIVILRGLFREIQTMLYYIEDSNSSNFNSIEDIKKIKDIFSILDEKWNEKFFFENSDFSFISVINNYYKNNKNGKLWDFLNEFLDPKKNNFENKKMNKKLFEDFYTKYENNEVWTDGPCVLIDVNSLHLIQF